MKKEISPFTSFIDQVKDTRNQNLIDYPLNEILFLVLTGTLCGCDKLTSIAVFGEEKLGWLQNYYPYKNGIPAHDTLGRVLGLINKKEFELLFLDWIKTHFDLSDQDLLHLDGKHLNGSADAEQKTKKRSEGGAYAEIIVNLYASAAGIALAHHNVSEHMSEVEGALEILNWFSIQDCCISGDSNFCRRRIIDKITDEKAYYLFALKGNSYTFYEATKVAFETVKAPKEELQTKDRAHGREEKRTYQSLTIDQLPKEFEDYYTGVEQLIKVSRNRKLLRNDKQSEETHYYVTNLKVPLTVIAQRIRRHWTIENQLHYVLDVSFGEDQSRVRTKNGATNLSLIRKFCFNLLKTYGGSGSIKSRQLRCALSDQQRDKILRKSMMR